MTKEGIIGWSWDYVILETIRKYPKCADIDLIERALNLFGIESEWGKHRPSLEKALSAYSGNGGWCLLNPITKYYSITYTGLTYLSMMTKYKDYDKFYKQSVSGDIMIGDIVVGAFSVLVNLLQYTRPSDEDFDHMVNSLLSLEEVNIFTLIDLLEYEPFDTYYKKLKNTSSNLKIRTEPVKSEYDGRLIGSLLMLDILLEVGPQNMIACMKLTPLYFRYHQIAYNPMTMESIRNTAPYKLRRRPLVDRIKNKTS